MVKEIVNDVVEDAFFRIHAMDKYRKHARERKLQLRARAHCEPLETFDNVINGALGVLVDVAVPEVGAAFFVLNDKGTQHVDENSPKRCSHACLVRFSRSRRHSFCGEDTWCIAASSRKGTRLRHVYE